MPNPTHTRSSVLVMAWLSALEYHSNKESQKRKRKKKNDIKRDVKVFANSYPFSWIPVRSASSESNTWPKDKEGAN